LSNVIAIRIFKSIQFDGEPVRIIDKE